MVAVWVRLPSRLFYREGRPTRIGRLVNHAGAVYSGLGLPPAWWVTLEIRGRRSGRIVSTTLVVGSYEGERYLVSMLGEGSAWVLNARAAAGIATIHHGRRRPIVLREVPTGQRAPILKAYLPEQMNREEILILIRRIIAETGAQGPRDKNKVMPKLMPLVKGKADGQEVNAVVTELLGS